LNPKKATPLEFAGLSMARIRSSLATPSRQICIFATAIFRLPSLPLKPSNVVLATQEGMFCARMRAMVTSCSVAHPKVQDLYKNEHTHIYVTSANIPSYNHHEQRNK
jgi:hypothetical protein